MTNVIDIVTKRPHLAGICRCMACGYQWAAVAPIGTVTLICPKCKCDGHFIGEILTEFTQKCCSLCEYQLFRRDEIGFYCPHCGDRKE